MDGYVEFYEDLRKKLPFKSLPYVPKKSLVHRAHADYNRWFEIHESRCKVWYGYDSCVEIFEFCCSMMKLPMIRVSSGLDYSVAGAMFSYTGDQPLVELPVQGANGYIILHELTHYLEFLELGWKRWVAIYQGRRFHHSQKYKGLLHQVVQQFPDIFDATKRFKAWAP